MNVLVLITYLIMTFHSIDVVLQHNVATNKSLNCSWRMKTSISNKILPGVLFLTLILLSSCKSIKHYVNHVGNVLVPEKIYYADFTRKNINQDPKEFPWFDTTYRFYNPDTSKIKALKPLAMHMSFRVFGGSWCGDTKRLLPRFYKVTDALGIADSLIYLSGVDRQKRSGDALAERYQVNRIPVFILYYNDKEAGRIVETTKNGIEADMLNIYTTYLNTVK